MTQRAERRIEMFSADNIHGVAELAKAVFSTPWSEEIYRRELENPQSVGFVCISKGEIAGFIHCSYVLDELTLNTLCVAESCRRQGIAKALWRAATEMMTGICSVCYLEVRESNTPARTLYESLGFIQNGYRPRYYSHPEEAAVLMRCELAQKE